MIRTIKRNMARNRLKDMGYDRVNKRLGYRNGVKGGRLRRATVRVNTRTRRRRAVWETFLKEHPPIWKRVLEGDLRKKAIAAERAASRQRKIDMVYR